MSRYARPHLWHLSEPKPLMQPLQAELDAMMYQHPDTDQMPCQERREWMLKKMDAVYALREEGYSFDDIGLRYPLTANSIRKIYRAWLEETGKTDPREK